MQFVVSLVPGTINTPPICTSIALQSVDIGLWIVALAMPARVNARSKLLLPLTLKTSRACAYAHSKGWRFFKGRPRVTKAYLPEVQVRPACMGARKQMNVKCASQTQPWGQNSAEFTFVTIWSFLPLTVLLIFDSRLQTEAELPLSFLSQTTRPCPWRLVLLRPTKSECWNRQHTRAGSGRGHPQVSKACSLSHITSLVAWKRSCNWLPCKSGQLG